MKKKLLVTAILAMLAVSGCVPGGQDEEVLQDIEENIEETVIIPEMQLQDHYYRTLLPFKKSASRGLIVNALRTKYDIQEAEEGLLRLSRNHFDTEKYFFQEGQYVDEETARAWIGRKSDDNPEGLNPPAANSEDGEAATETPMYLAHIIEQNYLIMTDEKKVRLDGIAIGLAMNSVYITRDGKEITLSDAEVEQQGKIIAEEVVTRLRTENGLDNVKIAVGLFKQEKNNSIIPGSYFASAIADKGKSVSKWKKVNEQHVLFPSSTSADEYLDVNNSFLNFKQAIGDYFPGFVNVIGRGLYMDGNLSSMSIEIPIQFFGTSETIGFTQYVAGLVTTHLPNTYLEVSITSTNGPEALIIHTPDKKEPTVHIYGY